MNNSYYYRDGKKIPAIPPTIADILLPLLREKGMLSKLEECKATIIWDSVVGKDIARYTRAEKIEDGILYIKVRNAAWRQELTFQKETIKKKLNRSLEKEIVKDIKFI